MKPLPAHLPPLPAGAVYLGLGGTFAVDGYFSGWTASSASTRWNADETLAGTKQYAHAHYAAPADSEIARLNAKVEPQSVHIVWSASRQEPTKTHPSRESAIAEAKRLCAKHPTHEFFVFERVAGFKGTVTVESIVP